MTPAETIAAAAAQLRDLTTRTTTTLERHEVQWADLTVSDTAANAKGRPMVWSQYAATMSPDVGEKLARWLWSWVGVDFREDAALPEDAQHALAVARAVLGTPEARP